jgi:hypothetical protein
MQPVPLKLRGIYCTVTRRHTREERSPQQQRPDELKTHTDTHIRVCVVTDENSNTSKLVYYPRMTNGWYS